MLQETVRSDTYIDSEEMIKSILCFIELNSIVPIPIIPCKSYKNDPQYPHRYDIGFGMFEPTFGSNEYQKSDLRAAGPWGYRNAAFPPCAQ